MAVLTPSTTTGYNIQKWQRSVEGATYQKMVTIPIIDEGDRPLNTLNIRKHARVSSSSLAQSAEGTSLTYATLADTPVTLTPAGNYVAVAWSQNEEAQIDFSLDSEARGEIEQALAESSDQSVNANFATLTQSISGATLTGNMWRKAVGRLMGNTNGVAAPGGGKPQIHGVFSHTTYPYLGEIEEFNRAEVRGDDETPYVKGIWMRGGGVLLHLTTTITQDGNGYHNCIFIPSAFVVAWNTRSLLKRQDIELQNRLILYNNFGSAVKHDLRGIDVRVTTSGIA